MPVCNGKSGTSMVNHSDEASDSGETSSDLLNGVSSKEPPQLREVDTELLQSGKLMYTGKFHKGPLASLNEEGRCLLTSSSAKLSVMFHSVVGIKFLFNVTVTS